MAGGDGGRARRRIGPYQILDRLGAGGMGTVWRAEDTRLGRVVALKLLHGSGAASPADRQRFLREARVASSLDHPGIATVFEAGEADGELYIAFQLVDGRTVHELLGEGVPPVGAAVRIVREAAEALKAAHEKGLVHRDVTARNLMIHREGRVVVVDFGLAFSDEQTRLTRTGAMVGTASYVSPEVIQGGTADARSDLYGLGVVFYELLTGELPHEGKDTGALLHAVLHGEVVPPSRCRKGVPAALDAVVLRLLERDPVDRYATVDEFLAALAGFPEQPIPVPGEGTAPMPVRRTSRRSSRVRRPTSHELIWGIAAVLSAAVLFFGGRELERRRGAAEGPETYDSIAVLPLTILESSASGNEAFAEGIGTALTSKLTQLSGLHVTPWSTSRVVARQELSPPEAASMLGVDVLLLGTFQAVGERVQGNLILVDGETGFQIWAMDYRETVEDIFEAQRRIAVSLATRLRGGLTGEELADLGANPTESVEAYRYYLEGARAMLDAEDEDGEAALGFFRRAIEVDPELAEAHVGIGAVHTDRYYRGLKGGGENLALAEKHHRRALALDPDLHAARRGLIRVHWGRGETEECLRLAREVERSGDRSEEALLARADAYFLTFFAHKAIPLYREVLERDPASAGALFHLAAALVWNQQYEQGLAESDVFLRRFGEDPEVYFFRSWAAVHLGNDVLAEQCFERAIELYGEHVNVEVFLYYGWMLRRQGNEEWAIELFEDGRDLARESLGRYPSNLRYRAHLADYYAALGDTAGYREALTLITSRPQGNGLNMMDAVSGTAAFEGIEAASALARKAFEAGERTAWKAVPFRAGLVGWGPRDWVDSLFVRLPELREEYERLDALY